MQPLKTLSVHEKGVWTIDCNPEVAMMATGGSDHKMFIYDSKTYKIINEIKIHNEALYDIKFSKNGKYMSSCSKGVIYIWDVKDFSKPLKTIEDEHGEFIYSTNFLDNDRYLVSGFIDGYLLIVDLTTMESFKQKVDLKKRIIEGQQDPGNSVLYHLTVYRYTAFPN